MAAAFGVAAGFPMLGPMTSHLLGSDVVVVSLPLTRHVRGIPISPLGSF